MEDPFTGWWLSPPVPLWKIMEFVNLDHYSQYMEKKNVPNHLPVYHEFNHSDYVPCWIRSRLKILWNHQPAMWQLMKSAKCPSLWHRESPPFTCHRDHLSPPGPSSAQWPLGCRSNSPCPPISSAESWENVNSTVINQSYNVVPPSYKLVFISPSNYSYKYHKP